MRERENVGLGNIDRARPALAVIALLVAGCASSNENSSLQGNWSDDQRSSSSRGGIVPDSVPDPLASGSDVELLGRAGKLREPIETSVPIAGTDLVRGRSTVVVQAPIDLVRKTVLDYGSYAEFMPHYAGSRVLGRTKEGGHKVYMKWVALHGAMSMWARFDMSAAQKQGAEEKYSSTLVKGNVKAAKAIWRMSPIDEHRTKLSLEVFLQPRVPIPDSLLNEENTSGATKGVVAMRDRCEEIAP